MEVAEKSLTPTTCEEAKGGASAQENEPRVESSVATRADDGENEEDEASGAEDQASQDVVMRTEITVAIKDSAQPTVEEIKEFESFSSK